MAQNNFTIDIKIIEVWEDIITLKDFMLCEIGKTLYLFEEENEL